MNVKPLILAAACLTFLQALPANAEQRWDLYTIVGLNHPVAQQLQQFGDEVKKRTNGDVVITVRPAGELPFKPTEVVKITGEGQVQMGEALGSFMTGTVPIAGLLGLPLFLGSEEELSKAVPIVRKYMDKDLDRAGVKVLFHFLWPFPSIYGSGKPIRSPEDFAGRKLRVLSPQQAEMLKRLGGSSVSLTTPEVPVALERGTVEGVLTTAYTLVGSKWAEMTKWGYEGRLSGVDDYLIVNLVAYNKLSAPSRAALEAVAKEWGPKMTAASFVAEKESTELLRTKYKMSIVTASDADRRRMTDIMKPYWATWAQEAGPEAQKALAEVRAAVGK